MHGLSEQDWERADYERGRKADRMAEHDAVPPHPHPDLVGKRFKHPDYQMVFEVTTYLPALPTDVLCRPVIGGYRNWAFDADMVRLVNEYTQNTKETEV